MILPSLDITKEDSSLIFLSEKKTSSPHRIKRFLLSKEFRNKTIQNLDEIFENEEIFPQVSSKKKIENLFKDLTQINPLKNDFAQFNCGPRFDLNGLVIPHSIVGKPDEFMTQHYKEGKKNPISHNRVDSKEFRNLKLDSRKSIIIPMEKKNNISSEDSQVNFSDKKSSLIKPYAIKKTHKVKVSKTDLLTDLNLSIERQNQAKLDDLAVINKLELSDKLFLTKQTRILNKFVNYEQKWKNQLLLTEKKIKRRQESSVVRDAEKYRPKQEAAEAFQMTLNDYEKYGDKLWYMTLRLYNINPNDMKKVLYINDLPDGFKKAIVEKRSNIVEKIRKPTEEYDTPSVLYKTFTSKEYFSDKIKKNYKVLSGILSDNSNENFENFQVIFFKKIL